ncbi:uncharacterized protein LOC143558889 [Bidens hawaiensis]|uniref:uncharacterized protein LOC143558889 n=1 Tax=Bidens hawaiensis TaxID=980011 RepID=UPI00404AF369
MGVDGNNLILPLAFAIVENESYASWSWFLDNVKKHVVKDREGICLISDRHASILKDVNEPGSPWLEPRGFHRHFINNFNNKYRNSQLKALAYCAGSQNQVRKFHSIMDEIGKINPQAHQWLEVHTLDKWTLSHDGGKKYWLLTTNLLVHYFDVRRPLGSSAQIDGDVYTPHVVEKQPALTSKSSAHSSKSFNWKKRIYEVFSCFECCAKLYLNSWQYVDKCYSIIDYCDWSSEFSPLPHEAYWPQPSFTVKLLPNTDLKREKRGHPRSTRLRNGIDIKKGKKTVLCGICRQPGHNHATFSFKPRRIDGDH